MKLEPAVYWKLRAHVTDAQLVHAQGLLRQEQAERYFADAATKTKAAFHEVGVEMTPAIGVRFNDAGLEVEITPPKKD